MLRALLEKWSRGVILKKHLTPEFGSRTIFVSPEGGGLRYWKPSLNAVDPMLVQAIRQFIRPGQTIWDVGGNVGFFAFSSAAQTGPQGKVAVFEPDLSLAYLLRKTANVNMDLNIDIIASAVSNQDGVARFNIAQRARSTNYLADVEGSSQTGGIRQTISVPIIRLDTFLQCYTPPDFLKIDVEGAEHLVFEGMQNLLKSARPIILCEIMASNQPYIFESLRSAGYKIFRAENLPDLIEADGQQENIIAIPPSQK